MISFDVIANGNSDLLVQKLERKCVDADFDYVSDILAELSSCGDGCEYAVSAFSGCLLVRVYDGEYFFLYPEPVAVEYNIFSAIDELRLYAVREEIPLVIAEVPADEAENVAETFSSADIYEDGDDGEVCTVRVLSEIMLSDELPEIFGERLEIKPLSESDSEIYARLCRDDETNKYWGYNYSDDVSTPEDEYFIENAFAEYSRGVAASFGIRLSGEFIGEALLYAFDLVGGAECAVRLLPGYRGRRLSSECVELICDAARRLGLQRLFATVDNENKPSMNLFKKTFEILEEKENITRFVRKM